MSEILILKAIYEEINDPENIKSFMDTKTKTLMKQINDKKDIRDILEKMANRINSLSVKSKHDLVKRLKDEFEAFKSLNSSKESINKLKRIDSVCHYIKSNASSHLGENEILNTIISQIYCTAIENLSVDDGDHVAMGKHLEQFQSHVPADMEIDDDDL